jgi:O-antigen/teichoic acid export membrane protein
MAFLFLTAAIALIGGILWLNIGKIIALWVGSQPSSLDSRTTFLMGLNAVFVAIGMLQSMILNARGKIKEQAIVQLVFIAGLVPWKLALAAAAGPFGIVVALATAYVPRLIYVDRKLIKPGLKAGQAGAS